jgi:hypothetical protein
MGNPQHHSPETGYRALLASSAAFPENRGQDSQSWNPSPLSESTILAQTDTSSTERILIRCPGCDKKLKARRGDIGKKARCSRCDTKFRIRIDEPGGPDATILGLPRDAGHRHRDSERIAIRGNWISELGWPHDHVVLEVEPDLKAFLGNGMSDPVWPHDEEYMEFIESLDDASGYLRDQWTFCYLHHPRVSVLTSVLSMVGNRYRVSVGRRLTALLDHDAPSVRIGAADALWAKGSLEIAAAFRHLKEHGANGAELLVERCPEDHREELDDLYQRHFVEWSAGVEDVGVNPDGAEADS